MERRWGRNLATTFLLFTLAAIAHGAQNNVTSDFSDDKAVARHDTGDTTNTTQHAAVNRTELSKHRNEQLNITKSGDHGVNVAEPSYIEMEKMEANFAFDYCYPNYINCVDEAAFELGPWNVSQGVDELRQWCDAHGPDANITECLIHKYPMIPVTQANDSSEMEELTHKNAPLFFYHCAKRTARENRQVGFFVLKAVFNTYRWLCDRHRAQLLLEPPHDTKREQTAAKLCLQEKYEECVRHFDRRLCIEKCAEAPKRRQRRRQPTEDEASYRGHRLHHV